MLRRSCGCLLRRRCGCLLRRSLLHRRLVDIDIDLARHLYVGCALRRLLGRHIYVRLTRCATRKPCGATDEKEYRDDSDEEHDHDAKHHAGANTAVASFNDVLIRHYRTSFWTDR